MLKKLHRILLEKQRLVSDPVSSVRFNMNQLTLISQKKRERYYKSEWLHLCVVNNSVFFS